MPVLYDVWNSRSHEAVNIAEEGPSTEEEEDARPRRTVVRLH